MENDDFNDSMTLYTPIVVMGCIKKFIIFMVTDVSFEEAIDSGKEDFSLLLYGKIQHWF